MPVKVLPIIPALLSFSSAVQEFFELARRQQQYQKMTFWQRPPTWTATAATQAATTAAAAEAVQAPIWAAEGEREGRGVRGG